MSEFSVVVTFETTSANHDEALRLLDEYIGDFLAQQPGFIESHLVQRQDGTGLLHFALWQQESDFRAFAELAKDHPLLPVIREFSPSASFYRKQRSYASASSS